MTDWKNESKCPRCGERASGKFCPGCGGALGAQNCASCAKRLTPGARFCHHCGATAGAGAAAVAGTSRMPPTWAIVASVLVVLAAFVAGQKFGGGGSPAPASAPGTVADMGGAPFAGGATRAPDISNMSPEEAANRLFDRVMRYATEGKPDSAAMFAPMAIMAYERIGPLDAHSRYDIGTISAVIGDVPLAAAQADTILKTQPNHLLGLLLAARAADLGKKPDAAARLRTRFAAAVTAEKAKGLREYTDHQREIDEALSKSAPKQP